MNMIKYDKYDLAGLFNWDSLLERLLNSKTGEIFEPPVNLYENEQKYTMEIDFAGISNKNVEIKVSNRTLTISAKKYRKITGNDLLNTKIRTCDFKRTFVMPKNADENRITKNIKNGVLRVYVQKIRF